MKINKYAAAKYNLDKALEELETVRSILIKKENFESPVIDSLVKKLEADINNLKKDRSKLSNSTSELRYKKSQFVSTAAME